MTTLHRYVARLFLLRFLLVLIGVSLAVAAFELTEVLGGDDWTSRTIARYTLLRLPSLMAQLLPVATLIAALLTVGELLRQRELVAAWSVGLSQFRLLAGLLPLLALLGLFQFLLNDQVVPRTNHLLREWSIGEFRPSGLLTGDDGHLWLRSGNDILRISAAALQRDRLVDVTIFRRDERGQPLERLDAATAERAAEGEGWLLQEVVRHEADPYHRSQVRELFWPGELEIAELHLVARPPQELPLADL